jgi:hypothetical protein
MCVPQLRQVFVADEWETVQAPYYAFSQTMMAELSPPGYDNMASFLPLAFPFLF